jgi:hypothetical protein
VFDSAAAYAHIAQRRHELAAVTTVFAAINLTLASAFAGSEHRIRHWCGASGAVMVVTVLTHYACLGRFDLILGSTGGDGVGLFFLYAASVIQRARSRRRAERIVTSDQAVYGACWARVLAADRRPPSAGGNVLGALLVLSERLSPPAPGTDAGDAFIKQRNSGIAIEWFDMKTRAGHPLDKTSGLGDTYQDGTWSGQQLLGIQDLNQLIAQVWGIAAIIPTGLIMVMRRMTAPRGRVAAGAAK